MKKVSILIASLLDSVSLAACGSKQSTSSSSRSSSAKVVKNHHRHKKHIKNPDRHEPAPANNKWAHAQAGPAGQQGKSQGEINRERGYDPNGAPLLPGQDHAAGANPDGSPDAWVQGQDEWAIQNGYMNPDGSNTAKGDAADAAVEQDSQPGMP